MSDRKRDKSHKRGRDLVTAACWRERERDREREGDIGREGEIARERAQSICRWLTVKPI